MIKIMSGKTYEREIARVDREAAHRGFNAAMKICEAERKKAINIGDLLKSIKEIAENISEAKNKPTGFSIE